MCVQKWEIFSSHILKYVCAGKEDRELGLIITVCVCVWEMETEFSLILRASVGKGGRVIALMNITYVYVWKGVTECLHSLYDMFVYDQVLALNNTVCICGKMGFIDCTN